MHLLRLWYVISVSKRRKACNCTHKIFLGRFCFTLPPAAYFRMAESRQRPVGKGGFRFPPFPTPNPLETTKHRGAAAPLLDVPPGPSIAASYNRGNTKQHRHAPMPTYAATERIPGSVTTPRLPPTQAAKKCWIGPQLVPVPPTESPVDGAGPLRGVKTGRRIPIWNHLTRTGAPFSLDSKNRSFSSREKETVFEPSPPSFHITERQRSET